MGGGWSAHLILSSYSAYHATPWCRFAEPDFRNRGVIVC